MGRKKKNPSRLPRNVSLGAYEVRLASYGQDTGPFGDLKPRTDWMESSRPLERDETLDGSAPVEKGVNHLHERYCHGFVCRLDANTSHVEPTMEEPYTFNDTRICIQLATIQLHVHSCGVLASDDPAIQKGMDVQNQFIEYILDKSMWFNSPGEHFYLELSRDENKSPAKLSLIRASDSKTIFTGLASYWLGANEEQLQTVYNVCYSGDIVMPCSVDPDTKIVSCALSVPHSSAFLTRKKQNTFEKFPGHMFWSVRDMLILMEWLFRGSISQNVSQPKQVLSTCYSKYSANYIEREPFKFDANELFKRIVKRNRPMIRHHCEGLVSELFPYQRKAVYWMLEREGKFPSPQPHQSIHDLVLCTYPTTKGRTFQLNPFNGMLYVPLDNEEDVIAVRNGGILGDEMGLGKTVEAISLILLNPAPDSIPKNVIPVSPSQNPVFNCCCSEPMHPEFPSISCNSCGSLQHEWCTLYDGTVPHYCLRCLNKTQADAKGNHRRQKVKSTLIVCPSSIAAQWQSEIAKHTTKNRLSVLVYDGVKAITKRVRSAYKKVLRHPKKTDLVSAHREIVKLLWPQFLGEYDIVITTYDVLRNDVVFDVERSGQKQLRHAKRYPSPPSPLLSVEFHRICLDEAQEVESSTAKATEMARHLESRYRWCVTGTPVGNNGLSDLHGLLMFLRLYPFDCKDWWNKAIVGPVEFGHQSGLQRLVALFDQVLWRNTKLLVRDQLRVPKLLEHVHRLEFSPLEKHFYQQQHNQVRDEASRLTGVNKSFVPLLRLRQACCHPQIGSFGIQGTNKNKKKRKKKSEVTTKKGTSQNIPMAMSEIHEILSKKAKLAVEEAQRLLTMNMNGVAGVELAMGKVEDARKTYVKILDFMNESEKNGVSRVDDLQRLHVLEGLRSILEDSSTEPSLTKQAHIDSYKTKINDIRKRFSLRFELELASAMSNFEEKTKLVDFSSGDCQVWITSVLAVIDRLPELRSSLIDQINSQTKYTPSSLAGLKAILQMELEKFANTRKSMVKAVRNFAEKPAPSDVAMSANCSGCHNGRRKGPLCTLCVNHRTIVDFENVLFSQRRENKKKRMLIIEEEDNEDQEEEDLLTSYHYRTHGDLESILRVVRTVFKSTPTSATTKVDRANLLNEASRLPKQFEQMITQLGSGVMCWKKKDALLKAYDELAMASTRIELTNDEIEPGEEQVKMHAVEAPVRYQELKDECARCKAQFNYTVSQMNFLKTIDNGGGRVLAKEGHVSDEQSDCPVCRDKYGETFCLLGCGHRVCNSCVNRLVGSKCPLCRTQSTVTYVTTQHVPEKKEKKTNNQPKRANRKSLGTKFDSVIQEILKMEANDPEAKCLVFSQWDEVLSFIEHGLGESDVRCVRLKGKYKYDERLSEFRDDPTVKVLLLPIKSGAKGLNLTEANHIFLVEPILSTSIEAQVIGRIHRIGQKRSCCHVHRFIVCNTIEERIHQMILQKRDTVETYEADDADTHEVQEEVYNKNYLAKQKEEITVDEIKSLFI